MIDLEYPSTIRHREFARVLSPPGRARLVPLCPPIHGQVGQFAQGRIVIDWMMGTRYDRTAGRQGTMDHTILAIKYGFTPHQYFGWGPSF